jgi:hypothetical protein
MCQNRLAFVIVRRFFLVLINEGVGWLTVRNISLCVFVSNDDL